MENLLMYLFSLKLLFRFLNVYLAIISHINDKHMCSNLGEIRIN